MDERIFSLAKTLISRGFQTQICENSMQAIEFIEKIVTECSSVNSIGFGNSITLKSIGLQDFLSKYTKNIYVHAPCGTEDTDRMALTADFYLTSANAVSLDGHIVNIDGTGNRTAATCFGPKHVIYIIGKNKVTETLEQAVLRAKNAAVKMAKRFKRKTPCTVSGICENCISPECICAVTTIHRKRPYGSNITVVLVNEELGV